MNLSEVFRAFLDYRQSSDFVKANPAVKEGDGHPVIVIPGFMGSKLSTYRLRKFLRKMGYQSYDWGLGRNMGDLEDVQTLRGLINRVVIKHKEKVTLIGWSLGGVYARELAKLQSDDVRQVITLGSPFADISAPNHAAWLHEWLQGDVHQNPQYTELLANLSTPANVPTTAVYSKEDGVVPWQVCRELKEDSKHQNVEVKGSHLGLTNNASVWYLISDRLRHTQKNWKPFSVDQNLPKTVVYPSLQQSSVKV